MNYYQYNPVKVAFWSLLFCLIGYTISPVTGMISALIFLAMQMVLDQIND